MKTGILLINLGTPEAPETSALKPYLKEFLLDERVLDISSLQRNLLVRGIIVPRRSPKSAAAYKEIWTKEGSPLLIYSRQQQKLLQEKLGDDYVVELAMRYGNPSIASVLEKMRQMPLKKIRVIPLYPQYASASTGTVLQRVMEVVSRWLTIPTMEWVSEFHDQPDMIDAFASIGEAYRPEAYDHVVFSFHGLPVRQIEKADIHGTCLKKGCCDSLHEKNYWCYRAQCYRTARLIAGKLGLDSSRYTVSFQSRLGKTEWIKPYTSDLIHQLAKEGKKKVLVYSPAFVCDCLETIFEIGIELAEEFKAAGGEELQLVPGLNTHEKWIRALEKLALQ